MTNFQKRHPEIDFNIKPEKYTNKRVAAKTYRCALQHFDQLGKALQECEKLNGAPLEPSLIMNLDEKPMKPGDLIAEKVAGPSSASSFEHKAQGKWF